MPDHDSLRDELRRRLDAKALKGKDVAKLLGTTPSRVSEMKAGKRQIQPREMDVLARFLGMEDAEEIGRDTAIDVPVIGLASAGAWKEATRIPTYVMKMAPPREGRKIAFAVEIFGDSMNMLLPQGGWAAIDPGQKTLFERRVYLIENGDHETTIKRYLSNPSRFVPVSTNPEHETIYMGQDEIRVIGRVVSYGNDEGL